MRYFVTKLNLKAWIYCRVIWRESKRKRALDSDSIVFESSNYQGRKLSQV